MWYSETLHFMTYVKIFFWNCSPFISIVHYTNIQACALSAREGIMEKIVWEFFSWKISFQSYERRFSKVILQ